MKDNSDKKFAINSIICADNSVDILYHGRKLHIIFMPDHVTILTDEKFKKSKITKMAQGYERMVTLTE